MTTTIDRARRALVALLALGACSEAPPTQAQTSMPEIEGSLFAAAPTRQWHLPAALHEISGLAVSPDGRLFAHNDEAATIYELNTREGSIAKSFTLAADGDDYEGLAITPTGDFWLTTSTGRLLRFREGVNGARVAVERHDTGLGDTCEVEGLAWHTAEDSLILACKTNRARGMRDQVSLYAWAPGGEPHLWRSLPEAQIAEAAGVRSFRPSSVEIDTRSGRLILLSARRGALVELGPEGEILAGRQLRSDHVQAEGVTILPDGSLVIADEGGDGRALLSVYGRVHD